MNALQKFTFEGLPVEVVDLNGETLFNATQIGYGLHINPSAVRMALAEMEKETDYVLVTNFMLENCSNVNSTDIRKLGNRGENFLTQF